MGKTKPYKYHSLDDLILMRQRESEMLQLIVCEH